MSGDADRSAKLFPRLIGAGIVLLAIPAAYAHEIAARSSELLAPAVHLILGVDHVLALVALGVLIGQADGMSRLDGVFSFGLTFFIGVYATQLMGGTALAASVEARASAASALLAGTAVAAGLRLPSWAPYVAGGVLGLVQGVVSGHAIVEGPTWLLSLLGAALAAMALLAMGAIVARRTSFTSRGSTAVRMFGAVAAASGLAMLVAGTAGV